jgi:very-short-patch-repair endonuclease
MRRQRALEPGGSRGSSSSRSCNKILYGYGYGVLHFTNDEVERDIRAVVAEVREFLRNHRPRMSMLEWRSPLDEEVKEAGWQVVRPGLSVQEQIETQVTLIEAELRKDLDLFRWREQGTIDELARHRDKAFWWFTRSARRQALDEYVAAVKAREADIKRNGQRKIDLARSSGNRARLQMQYDAALERHEASKGPLRQAESKLRQVDAFQERLDDIEHRLRLCPEKGIPMYGRPKCDADILTILEEFANRYALPDDRRDDCSDHWSDE